MNQDSRYKAKPVVLEPQPRVPRVSFFKLQSVNGYSIVAATLHMEHCGTVSGFKWPPEQQSLINQHIKDEQLGVALNPRAPQADVINTQGIASRSASSAGGCGAPRDAHVWLCG